MGTAIPHETVIELKERRNDINLELSNLTAEKRDAVYEQADATSIKGHETEDVRQYFKALYEGDEDMQLQYKDFTYIPDFDREMDKITSEYNDNIAQLTVWEEDLGAQITTDSTELEEVNAYIESFDSILKNNISNDFNYGLNK